MCESIIKIGDIPVNSFPSTTDALNAVDSGFNQKDFIHIAFINAHVINMARSNSEYTAVLKNTDLNLPDGAGMWIAGKWLYGMELTNLNGTDLGVRVLEWAARKRYRVFFLGAKPGVASKAKELLEKRIPSLRIAGCHHGYFGNDSAEIIKRINDSGTDILFVCMGVPFQDIWINNHKPLLNVKLALGLGAFFDFYSERVVRAPAILRRMKLEWAFRLIQEPKRLWKRYLLGNITFLLHIMMLKLRSNRRVAQHKMRAPLGQNNID